MATPIPGNRCEMTLAEVAQATGGRLFGDGTRGIRGISTDSRAIEAGGLFVALKGQTHNGHLYVLAAAARGAAAAVVGTELPALINRVEVTDTLAALGQIARYHAQRMRARRHIPTIAIGGAVGKTTTKELTAALCRALFGPTLSTAGNLNNLIGVPVTLFGLDDSHCAMVIECGTNSPGEIARLGEIVGPDVALVLNAEIEHTEGLGTPEGIADEESAMFNAARQAIVTCGEDELLTARLPRGRVRTVLFGIGERCDVRLLGRCAAARGRSRIRIGFDPRMLAPGASSHLEAELSMIGAAAALNAAAAIATVGAIQPLRDEHLELIADALASVQPVAGRLEMKQVGNISVLDDTYNSSPGSVRAALDAAREIADQTGARFIVAMGDMLELGALSGPMHVQAITMAAAARPAALIAVGPEMSAAATASRAPSSIRIATAPDSREAARIVRDLVRDGDLLLVKGSRLIAMERVIEGLPQ